MLPTQYLPVDNQLQININQVRNDGSLSFALILKVDKNKHSQGNNLIDSLVLTEFDVTTLLASDIIPPF